MDEDEDVDDWSPGFLTLPEAEWDGLLAVLDRPDAVQWLMAFNTMN